MANKKLGLIVPFRNREEQLDEFKRVIVKHLTKHKIPYEIIIVHQDDAKLFNRGMLLNIGFKRAEELKCDYVIFHDVDMLPMIVDYSYSDIPLHLANEFKKGEDREVFDEYFGGVTLFPSELFKKIDGYSNKYWGWGYEDTDLLYRCRKNNIPLFNKPIRNQKTSGTSLKLNGVDAYVKGKNAFNINNNMSIMVTFYPEKIKCNHNKANDIYNVFTIPGYDFAISYNSFSRYNFCVFNRKKEPLYLNSQIKINYCTTIVATIDQYNKIIKVYQDGKLIGEITDFENLYPYNKEPNFYLGVGNPNREEDEKYFSGYINSFAIYNEILTDDEIENINENKLLESAEVIYDAKYVKNYKLIDLSGNDNDGEIFNCEITETNFDDYEYVKVPVRRASLFRQLKHEENGFENNKWKYDATRWNQLRFHNEVCLNDELIHNDGLSSLKYMKYGITNQNNITHINVGI
jgi:uncharacterized pyridoxamine 5'-phosphate oxidase family protein